MSLDLDFVIRKSIQDKEMRAVIYKEKYDQVIPFLKESKSLALTALDAFTKLLTPEGKKSSQCALFQEILKQRKRRNYIIAIKERRFGNRGKLNLFFVILLRELNCTNVAFLSTDQLFHSFMYCQNQWSVFFKSL